MKGDACNMVLYHAEIESHAEVSSNGTATYTFGLSTRPQKKRAIFSEYSSRRGKRSAAPDFSGHAECGAARLS